MQGKNSLASTTVIIIKLDARNYIARSNMKLKNRTLGGRGKKKTQYGTDDCKVRRKKLNKWNLKYRKLT